MCYVEEFLFVMADQGISGSPYSWCGNPELRNWKHSFEKTGLDRIAERGCQTRCYCRQHHTMFTRNSELHLRNWDGKHQLQIQQIVL